jgi:hypothetical protein
VRMVIVGAIVISVPLVVLFQFITHSISASSFDPAACISTTDDVMQVVVVLTMALRWSDAAGRVPPGTPPVVIIVTPVSILLIMGWVSYHCCVQHRLDALNMRIDFLITLW